MGQSCCSLQKTVDVGDTGKRAENQDALSEASEEQEVNPPAALPLAEVGLAELSNNEALSPQNLRSRQRAVVEEAAELLGTSDDDAFLLLRLHCWSLDALSEDFFADADKAKRNAGIHVARSAQVLLLEGADELLCGICFCEPPMALLPCGHNSYCKGCWVQYASAAVDEGKACLNTRCPTAKCDVRLRPSDFRELLDGRSLERYERFELESFVDGNQSLAWCPGPRCNRAFQISVYSGAQQLRCPCGAQWCSACKADMHMPVRCEIVREWAKVRKDADASWIAANTKPCPKCKGPIEKNGGCMHMTCQKSANGCGYEFCWICLGDWSLHGSATGGYYKCNRYNPDGASAQTGMENAQRKSHFIERFIEQERAQRFASTDQRDHISSVADSFVKLWGVPLKHVEFLEAAVDEIVACRRFLKWTYAYACLFRMGAKQQELFDFHQSQFEGTLERLSDVMESTKWDSFLRSGDDVVEWGVADPRAFDELRGQVIGLTDVLKRSRDSLASAVGAKHDLDS